MSEREPGERGSSGDDFDGAGGGIGESVRDRLEEPIRRVTDLTNRTLAWFPVRVWRHFLARNGFLLAAGMSYQAIFAVFAGLYVAFAIAGIWLLAQPEAFTAFIELVNTFVPGLVGENGIVSSADLRAFTTESVSLFGWTGAAALAGVIWTAIGYVTYARIAIRSAFGLPKDERNYLLLKARDFLAGLVFGVALLVAALLSVATTSLLAGIFDLLDWDRGVLFTVIVRTGGLLVVFAIDTLSLATLFRFLSGAAVPWRRLWAGSLLGGAAIALLQLLANVVVTIATGSPLYAAFAAFAVFLGLLLWFRLSNIVILVAASWIAVEAKDRNESLRRVSPAQRRREQEVAERRALVVAASVRVREARSALEAAGWFERMSARRRLRAAEQDLAEAELDLATAEQRSAPPVR